MSTIMGNLKGYLADGKAYELGGREYTKIQLEGQGDLVEVWVRADDKGKLPQRISPLNPVRIVGEILTGDLLDRNSRLLEDQKLLTNVRVQGPVVVIGFPPPSA